MPAALVNSPIWKPGDGVQYLMQAGGDQQTVDEAKDTGTQRACGNDPFTARMDAMLYRRPDVTENSGQHQTEKSPLRSVQNVFHRRN
ncbi:Uncharacterised protein [Salmonella enterica subsp. enterica]|uniref:Uncharacterized protein n=1 Tax=Salmonella enterica I TaxID=59201 RepID=A0A3S4HYJ1_SALET|nr:Uncharacterised protein [Salmonella enterica subsp. enterica]